MECPNPLANGGLKLSVQSSQEMQIKTFDMKLFEATVNAMGSYIREEEGLMIEPRSEERKGNEGLLRDITAEELPKWSETQVAILQPAKR